MPAALWSRQQYGLGQGLYGIWAALASSNRAQNLAQLGQQGFGQGAAQTAQQAALAQQMYGMGAGTAGQLAGLGQGIYGMGAGTSQALAGLGSQAQQNALGAAQAQLGAGTLQQQTEQAGKTALYNQFLQEKGFPYQQAQFLANIMMGTGALSGSTTQTTQPAPFFSDKHLKEAVEPIGKTFDGQNIVKFRYKNEPGTRIGLIAQDVEKHHPDAVGLAGGYKTVDYDKATEAAARKGKYAHGGLIPQSEGGAVTPYRAGQGYADGGSPSIVGPAELAALQEALQAQLAMYGGAGLNISGTPGATGVVPAANLPTANLVTAGPLPTALNSGLKDAADTGEKIAGLYKSGKEFYGDVTEDEDKPKEDKAHGGLAGHYAMGGMPGKEGYIPEEVYKPQDEKKEIETPSVPGQGKSDFSQAVDAAKTAAQIAAMFAANGGRINKDYGGGLFLNPAGDFDAEKERNKISELNQYGRLIPDNSVQTAAIERSPLLERFMQAQSPQPAAQVSRPAARPAAQVAKRTSPGVAPPLSAPIDVPARPPIRSEETGAGMAPGLGGGNPPPPIISDMAGSPMYQKGLVPDAAQAASSPASTGVVPPPKAVDAAPPAPQRASFLEKAERMLAPKGGYLDRLSQGDEDTIVSLLSGIGAMAGSDNRYGLGALAEGVGAGAGAYQTAKQNILGRESTKADIGFRKAQTYEKLGATPGGGRYEEYVFPTPEGYVALDTMYGKQLTRAQYNAIKEAMLRDVFNTGAPGVASAATPDAVPGAVPGVSLDSAPGAAPNAGPSASSTAQKGPVSFNLRKPPDPSDVAKEFGRKAALESRLGEFNPITGAAVADYQKRMGDVNGDLIKSKNELDNAVADFEPKYGTQMHQIDVLADALHGVDPQRLGTAFADLIGYAMSMPFVNRLVPDRWKQIQEATDTNQKTAMLMAMANAGQLSGAPASALAASIDTVVNPGMNADTKRKLMKQAVASLLQQKAAHDTYTKYRNEIFDVEKFRNKFFVDNPLESFIPQADKMLGVPFAGQRDQSAPASDEIRPLTQNDLVQVKNKKLPVGERRIITGQVHEYNGSTFVPVRN
jgi:hypothetical protein